MACGAFCRRQPRRRGTTRPAAIRAAVRSLRSDSSALAFAGFLFFFISPTPVARATARTFSRISFLTTNLYEPKLISSCSLIRRKPVAKFKSWLQGRRRYVFPADSSLHGAFRLNARRCRDDECDKWAEWRLVVLLLCFIFAESF